MDTSEAFCGEMERHGSRPDTPGGIAWLLVACPAAWALRLAVVALVGVTGGCAHTDIKRGPDDCGTFSSTVVGVPPFYTPAGQYTTYAQACGAERFSHVVAMQRLAVANGARAAANGGRDAIAREEVARTQRDLRTLTDIVVGDLETRVAATDGGAR